MSNPYFKEAVQRGVELLDDRAPGWRSQVDVATLDLRSGCRCVLGQTFEAEGFLARTSGFEAGCDILDLDSNDVIAKYGFTLPIACLANTIAGGGYWRQLESEWIEELS